MLRINEDATKWCYKADLKSGSIPWCVDYEGYVGHADEGGCSGENYSCREGDN